MTRVKNILTDVYAIIIIHSINQIRDYECNVHVDSTFKIQKHDLIHTRFRQLPYIFLLQQTGGS
jgi:hypothetical protein